jgi:hypothetical protein
MKNYLFAACALSLMLFIGAANGQQNKAAKKSAQPDPDKPAPVAKTAPVVSIREKPAAPAPAPTKPVPGKPAPANVTVASILDDQPNTFSATQTYEQGERSMPGVQLMRKGNSYRIEAEQIGVRFAVIGRPDLKKVFTVRPDNRQFAESSGGDPFLMRFDPFDLARQRTTRNIKIETLGKEIFDGHPCNKYRISYDVANQVQSITVWKATDLNGLIIRQEQEFLNQKSSIRLSDIKLEAGAELFEPPLDFKQVKSNAELFQK